MFSLFRRRPYQKIEDAIKIKELFRAIAENVPKSEREQKITDMEEFKDAWKKALVDWDINGKILEEQVDGCHEMGNHELEEQLVNNAIAEIRIENLQYKLAR